MCVYAWECVCVHMCVHVCGYICMCEGVHAHVETSLILNVFLLHSTFEGQSLLPQCLDGLQTHSYMPHLFVCIYKNAGRSISGLQVHSGVFTLSSLLERLIFTCTHCASVQFGLVS